MDQASPPGLIWKNSQLTPRWEDVDAGQQSIQNLREVCEVGTAI